MEKTVYISGGITNVPNYPTKFRVAEELLIKLGFNVINPCRCNDILPPNSEHSDYMVISLAALSLCDSIYMLKDWENSKGANMEFEYALRKGYKIFFEDEKEYKAFDSFIKRVGDNLYYLEKGIADEV